MTESFTPTFLNIPLELKRRVACFLSPRDAIQVSRTCTTLRNSLALSSMEPQVALFERVNRVGDYDDGDRPRHLFRLPLFNRRAHSVAISFQWRDQGWGNQKGEVFITENGQDNVIQHDQFLGGGTVIYRSPAPAPHQLEPVRIEFSPSDGRWYHFWYKAGGGGGHSLFLQQGFLRTIIFDDIRHTMSRTYAILRNQRVLQRSETAYLLIAGPRNAHRIHCSFYSRMLLGVCKSLKLAIENGSPPDENLVEVFLSHGLDVSLESLLAVEELIQTDALEMMLREHEGPLLEQPINVDEGRTLWRGLHGRVDAIEVEAPEEIEPEVEPVLMEPEIVEEG